MEHVAALRSKNVGAHSICARGGLRRRERARADMESAPTILFFDQREKTPPHLLFIILRNGGAAYPMIPQEYIQEVVRRNDIEEVIGQYVQLHRRGRTATGLCPFHNEKTPSFVVYPGYPELLLLWLRCGGRCHQLCAQVQQSRLCRGCQAAGGPRRYAAARGG